MLFIGGISVTFAQAETALEILRSSPGMMVRQPLHRAGHPLADCDYHAAAAPYRMRAGDVPAAGRGAAGRHLTKPAFVIAVESALATGRADLARQEELERAVAALRVPVAEVEVEAAMTAFVSDHSYAVMMATAAVEVLRKRHAAGLRGMLRSASRDAAAECERQAGEFRCSVADACGTGACRLASGVLAGLASAGSRSSRGMSLPRPSNHVAAKKAYSPDAMLDSLLELLPWKAGSVLAVAV